MDVACDYISKVSGLVDCVRFYALSHCDVCVCVCVCVCLHVCVCMCVCVRVTVYILAKGK